jgi:anaerobic selenocysteine-containing dehydrogenase
MATLLEHFESGIIKELFVKGAINVNFMTYHRYYQVYQSYKKKGLSNNKSYQLASDECGCSEKTIRRAVKTLTE